MADLLSDRQRSLVKAWCALYAVKAMLDEYGGAVPECTKHVLQTLRTAMTAEARHRCALWEGRYWRNQHQEVPHG